MSKWVVLDARPTLNSGLPTHTCIYGVTECADTNAAALIDSYRALMLLLELLLRQMPKQTPHHLGSFELRPLCSNLRPIDLQYIQSLAAVTRQ